MMARARPLVLTLRARPEQRLDLSPLVPDRLAGMTEAEIATIELQTTRTRVTVSAVPVLPAMRRSFRVTIPHAEPARVLTTRRMPSCAAATASFGNPRSTRSACTIFAGRDVGAMP